MEKQHQSERAAMKDRRRAYIEELKIKLEEIEQSITTLEGKHYSEIEQLLAVTRQNLHGIEIEDNRLFEQNIEVESQLEATAKNVVDLAKIMDNFQKEIQEGTKEKEESKNLKSILESFENSLLCSICMEMFIDPYMLGCGHAFCKDCINGWQQKKKKVCPMCMKKITSCKDAFFYEKIISSTVMLMPEDARKQREEIIRQRKSQENNNKRAKKRKHPQCEEQITEVNGPSTSSAQYGIQPMPYITIDHMDLIMDPIMNPPMQDPFEWGERARRRRRLAPWRRPLANRVQAARRPYVQPRLAPRRRLLENRLENVGPLAMAANDLTNVPPAPAASISTNITGTNDFLSP